MRTFPDVRMRGLLALAERASAALNNEDPAAAKQAYLQLLRQFDEFGLSSAAAWWGLAVAHDYLGEHDMALNSIQKSLALDPLAPGAQRSFDIIVRRVREHLIQLDAKDVAVPRLYALLQQSGELDVPSHLAMAHHYAETGRVEQAEKLFQALCLLAPASKDVWEARAQFAATHNLGAEYEYLAEARGRAMADVPYGIPTFEED